MNVYIVTRGDYSDYHIVGATLDIKVARVIEKLYSDDMYQAKTETWNLDEFTGYERPLWNVYFYSDKKPDVVRNTYSAYTDANTVFKVPPNMSNLEYTVHPMANDKDRAIKIAEDLLAKYKAEQAGFI